MRVNLHVYNLSFTDHTHDESDTSQVEIQVQSIFPSLLLILNLTDSGEISRQC